METTFTLEINEAARIATALACCMAKNDVAKKHLEGVHLYAYKQGKFTAVATNGYKLGRLRLNVEGEVSPDFKATIPAAAVAWLGKRNLKSTATNFIRFAFSDTHVTLEDILAKEQAMFDLIDLQYLPYPDYEKCSLEWRKPNGTTITLSASMLEEIVKAAKKVSDKHSPSITLTITGEYDPALFTCDYKQLEYVQMPTRKD